MDIAYFQTQMVVEMVRTCWENMDLFENHMAISIYSMKDYESMKLEP
jgi:hypothetical protein